MASEHTANVVRYYDSSQWVYNVFWMNKRNLAMHYGFWDEGIARRTDALMHVNRHLARNLDIQATDVCLDAGCGVGGTAIALAEECDARVIGVTLNKKQVALAQRHIKRRRVQDQVSVECADFCDTGLPSETFDKIYAIESVCHAVNKVSFFNEAFRLLKPGGRLAVYDYFLAGTRSVVDQQDHETFCEGWAMAALVTEKDFKRDAATAGFSNARYLDCTSMILPSARIMESIARAYIPIDQALNRIGLVADEDVVGDKASIVQRRLFADGVLFYGAWVFTRALDAR